MILHNEHNNHTKLTIMLLEATQEYKSRLWERRPRRDEGVAPTIELFLKSQ